MHACEHAFLPIRSMNEASKRAAERSGMMLRGMFAKRYYGIDMPRIAYSIPRVEREDALSAEGHRLNPAR